MFRMINANRLFVFNISRISIHFHRLFYFLRKYFLNSVKFIMVIILMFQILHICVEKSFHPVLFFFTSCQNRWLMTFSRFSFAMLSHRLTLFLISLDWGIGRNYNSWQNYFWKFNFNSIHFEREGRNLSLTSLKFFFGKIIIKKDFNELASYKRLEVNPVITHVFNKSEI